METSKNNSSLLFYHTVVEAKDELDEKLERCYSVLTSLINGVSEKEAHDTLNATISKGLQNHEEISLGLVVGIITDPTNAARYYRDLTYVTRDGLALVIGYLTQIILEKYTKLQDTSRTQLIWLLREMIRNSVPGVDGLCYNLLRQIAGGDTTPKNIWLAESMLDIFIENRGWLEKFSLLVATAVYTYLRLIVDHGGQILAILRQREVDFCISLLRERFTECMMIGRDLVRLLQNVARISEFEKLWRDILFEPTSLAPSFTGVLQLLTTRTSRRFLQSRLTPDMERKIVFLTSQVRFGQQKRYQDWFQKQYLSTPDSQSLRCDLIRFICGVIHPSNEVLCSDIIPRWAVIGWLLTTCTSNVAASNAKLSLFYDWLFFDAERDNIMNIEPAILVMYHSMRPHPAITATLLDFLCRIMTNFYVPLTGQVKQGIYSSLRQILEKRVLPSLSPLFDNPKLDKDLRAMVIENFGEFCSVSDVKPEEPLQPRESEVVIIDGNHTGNLNNSENEAQFSEDEDDIPLDKLRVRDIKFRPIKETSKVEQMDIGEYIDQLSGDIKKWVINLKNEKVCETRCEMVEKLLQAILQGNDFDQDTASTLGICLAHILNDEFTRKIFPQEVDDESLEDSIGTPLFVMFRNLCLTPEEDPSRQPQLMVLAEIAMHQPKLGCMLLYFVKASKIQDTNMSSYRDLVKSLDSKDLSSSLLDDLRMCQDEDVHMFCFLIPDIYTQFPNIAVGNAELLNLIVSCIDASQLQDLICHILQGYMILFRKESFLSVLNASLEWETFEQFCLWQLIAAHNIPVDYILPILPKLEYNAHAEALTSILLMLKKEKPSAELLRHIMSRQVRPNDHFVVSVLKFWSQEHEEKLAELVSSQLSKATSTPNKRKRNQANKSQAPSVDQTLAHLDQLRQHCKQTSFFNQEMVQASLLHVQISCSEGQKTKFSDLFALTEELDSMRTNKSTRGKGKGPKGSTKYKQPVVGVSDATSSEDEETLKPKPPRKKKKAAVVGSDSD
ncbi:integrator complex subunit 3-like isoform X1 [Limulus polyphemus]|uniref:SOSS complex subunit A homolog n=1 Tax=Limulus polyphemus TaxID=6850 RepID=A0ABM1T8H1_LIMPO|nr:integrator complex subunit 3-like isoform X1 [Limulus polyphemus]